MVSADSVAIYQITEDVFQGPALMYGPPENIKGMLSLTHTSGLYELTMHTVMYIEDGPSPGLAWLKAALATIDTMHQLDLKVYVHCAAGISRSSLVCAAHLMKKLKLTRREALDMLEKKNPRCDPAAAFLTLLHEYEGWLRAQPDWPKNK